MLLLSSFGRRFAHLAPCLLIATASFAAAPKVDLTPYLGVVPKVGDYRLFTRIAGGQPFGEREITLVLLERWRTTGWRGVFTSETRDAGPDFDGRVSTEQFLIPGKQLFWGSEYYLANDLLIYFRKPAKDLKLLVTPGKEQRLKQKAVLVKNDLKVGNFERRATWVDDGFETVETPSGTYEDALRARGASTVRLRLPLGNEVLQLESLTLWYAEGLGLVRSDIELEIYFNGGLEQTESWTELLSEFGSAH